MEGGIKIWALCTNGESTWKQKPPWGSKSRPDWGPKTLILWKTVRNKEYPSLGLFKGDKKTGGVFTAEEGLASCSRDALRQSFTATENIQFIPEKEWPAKAAEWNEIWLRHFKVEHLVEEQEPMPTQFPWACIPTPRWPFLFSRKQSNLLGHLQFWHSLALTKRKHLQCRGVLLRGFLITAQYLFEAPQGMKPKTQTWSEVTAETFKLLALGASARCITSETIR